MRSAILSIIDFFALLCATDYSSDDMPASYSRLRLARLRELCALHGILTEGLRKPELIAALSADDDLYVEDEDRRMVMQGVTQGVNGQMTQGRMKRTIRMGISYPTILTTGRLDLGQLGSIPSSEALKLKQIELQIEKTRLEQLQEAQLMLTTGSTRLAVSRGQ